MDVSKVVKTAMLSFLALSATNALTATANAAQAQQMAPETYTLDPQHTAVVWNINHFGFSNPSGKWYASGKLILNPATPQNSQVDANIQVGSLVTGNPQLDEHLKSKLFFDVAQYPVATFKSDQVKMISKDSALVIGMLTLHGITKPLTLKVHLNKEGVNPINNKMTAGFSADATLKRSDFGMTSFLPGLSDKVVLHIEAEAYR